jgi:multiple sugar transport system substrate-binding protein
MIKKILLKTFLILSISGISLNAYSNSCIGKVDEINVLIQAHPAMVHMEKHKGDFEKMMSLKVNVTTLGEQERRSQSRVDASTGAGGYHVYYVDEANIAEFVKGDWVESLDKYYPASADMKDFQEGKISIGNINGTNYFAPFMGGQDVLMYRKDIFEEKGISVPTNTDELLSLAKSLTDAPNMYGWAQRGQRGSGMNVWRWNPYHRGFGGEWTKSDGSPNINSKEAVAATEYYMKLFDYAPPGGRAGTWSDQIEAFRAGKVAMMTANDVFGAWVEDAEKSSVVGKVGYADLPSPILSGGFAHGLAISKPGTSSDCEKVMAGELIGWATGKDMESMRLDEGIYDIARKSSASNPKFTSLMPADFNDAVKATSPKTSLLIWKIPEWPAIGDELGLVLEELFTGTRTDVQGSLDEVQKYAIKYLEKSK